MNPTAKLSLLVSLFSIVVVIVVACSATADPNTNLPPSEDWIFDSGKMVTILNKDWDINYNITVTGGTSLKIQGCDWKFDGNDPETPIWIYSGIESRLEIAQCTFDGEQGSTGFYIETHNTTIIANTEFNGMVGNPDSGVGVSVYGCGGGLSFYSCFAELSYVTLHNVQAVNGLYSYNSDVNISNSEFYDIDGTGALFVIESNVPDKEFSVHIVESDFHDVGNFGLHLNSYYNNGNVVFNCYIVKVYNIAETALRLEDGEKGYSTDRPAGYGSVHIILEDLEVYNCGHQGMWIISDDKLSGPGHLGFLNISIINSRIHNITNTGIYWIRYYSICKANLMIENTVFEDIAMEPQWNRLSAIFCWRYGAISGGYDNLSVYNTTFRRCNPGGLWFWDRGAGLYGVGGIPRYFYFFNCTFTQCPAAALFRVNDEGGEPGYFIVENCSFYDNGGHAILIDNAVRPGSTYKGMTAPHSMIEVYNSTFTRHGKSVLAVTSNSIDQAQEIGFVLENCLIEHSEAYAVDIRPNSPLGVMYVHMNNSRVNDTMGIYLFYDDEVAATAGFDVRITNSTIENSTLTALSVRAQGNMEPEVNIFVEDTTITRSGRDGISIHAGPVGTADKISGLVVINRVTIVDVDGVGIKITNDKKDVVGERFFYINYTSIRTAQQGVIIMGFTGEMWYTKVKDILLEDMRVTFTRVDVWYCEFTTIDEQKFKVAYGGEIFHYYFLTIYIKWETGGPALGCTVELMDNIENLLTVQTVNRPDGSLPKMSMNSYIIKTTGISSSSPYNLKATSAHVTKRVAIKLDRNKEVTIIMKDGIQPEVYVHFPRDGHAQQSTILQVRGTAWDYQSNIARVELSLDGVNWETATGKLRWNHTLHVSDALINETSGVFNLRVRAVDYAGNQRSTFVLVYIDPTPPRLLVDFPRDGYVTNDPQCLVRGVTELGSSVHVNGVQIEVIVSMFTYQITLVEGPNTLTVIAIDPMGNIEVKKISVVLDTQRPFFHLVNPKEDSMTNEGTLVVIAQLEPDLDVTINGLAVVYGSEEYPEEGGILEYPLSLESGDNIIKIQAMDRAGNHLYLERRMILDSDPPWVLITSPQPDVTFAHPEITVEGTTEATARLFLNDEDVTLQNGYFERVVLGIEGMNTIVLRIIDIAGNVYEESIIVYVDTEPPFIEITNPIQEITTINTQTITLEGTVYHDGVVTTDSIVINGEEFPLTDPIGGTFSIPLDLIEGKNEITVEVMDGVGNLATQTREVWLDTTPPSLVLEIEPMSWTDGLMTSPAPVVNITGHTESDCVVYINDILLSVDENGAFEMLYQLMSKDETIIISRSTDPAGNTQSIEQTITYEAESTVDVAEAGGGQVLFLVTLIILVFAIIVAYTLVRQRHKASDEEEGIDDTVVVELEPAEVEEPMQPEGPEAAGIEEAATETPEPQQRPVPKARRPQPKVVEQPVEEDKPLSDQEADVDIKADESEQEGVE